MFKPSVFICSISFWPGDTTTAMSVESVFGQYFFTLSYIRSAVALSMDTTIALPWKPRPVKWRTMSFATVSSLSSRVIRWYWRESSFSSRASCSGSRPACSISS